MLTFTVKDITHDQNGGGRGFNDNRGDNRRRDGGHGRGENRERGDWNDRGDKTGGNDRGDRGGDRNDRD